MNSLFGVPLTQVPVRDEVEGPAQERDSVSMLDDKSRQGSRPRADLGVIGPEEVLVGHRLHLRSD
jgi:hypothetical protein